MTLFEIINRPIVYSSLFSFTGCGSVLSSVYLCMCPPGCAPARVYSKRVLATVFLRGLRIAPTFLKLRREYSFNSSIFTSLCAPWVACCPEELGGWGGGQ